MKHISLKAVFMIVTIVTFSAQLSAQDLNKQDSIALAGMFTAKTIQWKDAYNSKDASSLVPLYSHDAQYISSHVPGLVSDGRGSLITNFQNGMNMGGHIDLVEIIRMDFTSDLATLLCKYQATNGGVTVTGRNLLILKKFDGEWLIVLNMTVV